MTYLHDHNDANIINLVKAMDYNAAGQPIIRTSSSQSGYSTGGNLDGTRETLVLCALATTNNDDAVGTLTWQEDV